MPEQIIPNLYRIPVPLPGNPLKELNAYLIRGTDRPLLIDTGFRQEACRQAALPGRRLVRCRRAVSNSSPMNPRRRSQQRKVYLGLSVSGRVGLAALVVSA